MFENMLMTLMHIIWHNFGNCVIITSTFWNWSHQIVGEASGRSVGKLLSVKVLQQFSSNLKETNGTHDTYNV